jgi:uncharacterized protein (DUF433 family)
MSDGRRSVTIWSVPPVRGGEPLVWGSGGASVRDLLDRVDAGDPPESVAADFLVEPSSLELLLELRNVLSEQKEREES